MIKTKNYTEAIADLVVSFDRNPLSDEDIIQVKKTIIDYVCAAVTGSKTEVSNKLYRYLKEKGNKGSTHVIGYKSLLSIEDAAFLNGTSAHCLDFDDGHTGGSLHPGSVVIPAVLSCAQDLEVDSERIMKAIIIGYELCIRISSAIHPSSRMRGFHNTPVAGIFGATGALAYLHQFGLEDTKQALGIAGSFASGLFAFLGSGSEIKRLHPGIAARDAVTTIYLTKKGITGPKDIMENENGVLQAFAGFEINEEQILGEDEKMKIHQIYFKPYPCCRHLHSSIDALQILKQDINLDIAKIKDIKIGVNSIAYLHRHKKYDSLLDAQMSLPYAAAATLVFEKLNMESFIAEDAPAQVFELMDRIHIFIDDEAEKTYPEKRLANVQITLKDEQTFQRIIETPLGEPSNPVSKSQLEKQFFDNCIPILGKEKTSNFIKNINDWSIYLEDPSFLYEL